MSFIIYDWIADILKYIAIGRKSRYHLIVWSDSTEKSRPAMKGGWKRHQRLIIKTDGSRIETQLQSHLVMAKINPLGCRHIEKGKNYTAGKPWGNGPKSSMWQLLLQPVLYTPPPLPSGFLVDSLFIPPSPWNASPVLVHSFPTPICDFVWHITVTHAHITHHSQSCLWHLPNKEIIHHLKHIFKASVTYHRLVTH